MIIISGINLWAIAVVWLFYLVVGAFWYSPAGFAHKWTKYTDINILEIPSDRATKIVIAIIVSCLVQVVTLAVVTNALGLTTFIDGFIAGIVLWFGFTAATTVGVTLYSKRSWWFLWLNSAYFLVVMSFGAGLLTVWK
jgi:hypothetical protein